MLSPVIVFAYNRPRHLQYTLEALNRNDLAEDTELFIFCDGAKGKEDRERVDETRGVVENFASDSKFKNVEISYSDVNRGLANSVISGVSRILQRFETVIVLEDDIVPAPDFLKYMNDCLVYYGKDSRVGAISAYTPKFRMPKNYQHDLFLSKRGNSWGWATWKEIWEKTDWEVSDFSSFSKDSKRKKEFNATQFRAVEMLSEQMNGQIDSWAIRWDYSFFVRGLYTVYPVKTKVDNIGCDGSGTHGVNEKQKVVKLNEEPYKLEHLLVDEKMIRLSSENVPYIVKALRGIRGECGGGNKNMVFGKQLIKAIGDGNIIKKFQRKKIIKIQKMFPHKIRCGNDYGGFDIIIDQLESNRDLIVYSFGIGEDLSFSEDVDLNFSAQIFAFDPTPKAIHFVKSHPMYQKENFHFVEKGIASKDCRSRFYLPENEEYVSGSCIQHDGLKADYIEVELCKLKSFMSEFEHNEIDILKMDIEGSEFDVIEDILKDGILFSQLCLEVHDYFFRDGNEKLKALIRALNENGYLIGSIKGEHEITFVKVGQ